MLLTVVHFNTANHILMNERSIQIAFLVEARDISLALKQHQNAHIKESWWHSLM